MFTKEVREKQKLEFKAPATLVCIATVITVSLSLSLPQSWQWHSVKAEIISLQGSEWYGTKLHSGLMRPSYICSYTRGSLLGVPWRPCRPSYKTLSWQLCILLCSSYVCHPTFELHRHSTFKNRLKTRLFFCTASAVWRHCSDFMDILWCLINCHFIIIASHWRVSALKICHLHL